MDERTRQSIKFGSDLKSALKKAERDLGFGFEVLKAMIDRMGGVTAARKLLASEDHFKSGFLYLRDNDKLDLSVEALVVKYADAGIFDPDEIEIAQWRLANASTVDNEDADEAEDESE